MSRAKKERARADGQIASMNEDARMAIAGVRVSKMETDIEAVQALAPAYGLIVQVLAYYGDLTNNGTVRNARGEDSRILNAIQKNVNAILTALIERVKAIRKAREMWTVT